MFGLTGAEGNHGEDAKEYWWYLDALPSHAWNRWRYHYPQRRVPVRATWSTENGRRGKLDPEYELLDTGVFDDDRYWVVDVDYAKAIPIDLLMTIRVTNAGPGRRHPPRAADGLVPQHVVLGRRRSPPSSRRTATDASHRAPVPRRRSSCTPGPAPTAPPPSCCSATTRPTRERLFGVARRPPYPKDGINDHVVYGAATVNPERRGTKCAAWYRVTVAGGRDRRAAAAAASAARPAGDRVALGPTSTTSRPRARPRPTSSTPS